MFTQSVEEFTKSAGSTIQAITENHEPIVLTVEGSPQVVVQDLATYQQMCEELERLQVIKALQLGFDDVDAGRVTSFDVVREKLDRKYGI